MNPLMQKLIGSLLRAALQIGGTSVWALSDEQTETVVGASMTLIGVGWSMYQKYRAQKETNTALALPRASTFVEVKQAIEATGGAPAMLPANAEPSIKGRL